jgi:hypothetical protein
LDQLQQKLTLFYNLKQIGDLITKQKKKSTLAVALYECCYMGKITLASSIHWFYATRTNTLLTGIMDGKNVKST